MSLDLNKLENKLDEALSNETSETLTKFLNDKRMTNNKQQTPHGFCETPEQKCTMNYCDENGCQNRKRTLTEPIEMTDNKEQTAVQLIIQALDIECKSRGMNVNWDMYLEKEREQIEYSFENGFDISYLEIPDDSSIDTSLEAKRFYNETYGGDQ